MAKKGNPAGKEQKQRRSLLQLNGRERQTQTSERADFRVQRAWLKGHVRLGSCQQPRRNHFRKQTNFAYVPQSQGRQPAFSNRRSTLHGH